MGKKTGKEKENENVDDHRQHGRQRPSAHSKNKKWKTTSTQPSITHRTGQEKLRVKTNKNTAQTGAVQDTKINHTSPQVGKAAATHQNTYITHTGMAKLELKHGIGSNYSNNKYTNTHNTTTPQQNGGR